MGTLRSLWYFTIYLGTLINFGYGCDIQGVANAWLDLSVTDTDSGIFFQGTTANIGVILSAAHGGDGLNFGPYFEASHENNQFILRLHDNFASYERYETVQTFSVSVSFSCTNGNPNRNIVFIISVIDTNNNDPVFTPTEEFAYTVTPPLPPGYQITGCVSDINVEDIDLTTQRIDFNVDNGDGLFEVVYDPAASTAKNFRGILRTTNFVRSIPEPLILTISATDVDLTGGPQRTTYTTVRIESDGEFEYPEEPVFSQPLYLASYTEQHTLSHEPISLGQGYAEDVALNLSGVYSQYFDVSEQNNVISLTATTQLPNDVLLEERQLYLVVHAVRELTDGASAAVVVQLPEVPTLQFQQQLYEGTIVDNTLSISTLVLSQGHENGYTVSIAGEYEANFGYTIQGNVITLTMTTLDDSVIEANNAITLQVIAVAASSSATAVVSLNIVKNDTATPLFENNVYSGSYNPTLGLALQDIVLSQGYDETVSLYLEGEHNNLFRIIENLNVVNLQLITNVPQEVIDLNRDILLTLSALKPRTVGANTAISIALPRARELGFERPSYSGRLQDNVITIDVISLTLGYDADVTFDIIGDPNRIPEESDYFTVTNTGSEVTVAPATAIPDSVISENNHLVLTLLAAGTNAITTSTTIVLEIIKDDTITPVFSQNVYYASYAGTEAGIEIDTVTLSQGYDDTVSFRLDGEHAQYFNFTLSGNAVMLSLPIVPEEVVFTEKTLIFNVIAEKPLTVGGRTVVAVSFPPAYTERAVLAFSKSAYVGTLDANQLTLELEDLVLESGYAVGTQFSINGEYDSYFSLVTNDNTLEVSLSNPLPAEVLRNNKFLVLQVTAQRERAVPVSATVIIDITNEPEIPPVFSEAFYSGSYTIEGGLQFTQVITLAEGYDETVVFALDEEVSDWFTLQPNADNIDLVLSNLIPEDTVFGNRQLLFSVTAYRGDTVARTAVSIDLTDESPSFTIQFAISSHVGIIENGTLELNPITLLNNNEGADFRILGEYDNYFNITQNGEVITLELINQLPDEVMLEQPFIVFDIEATNEGVSATTTVVLEIVRATDPAPTPVFSQAYYSGSYSAEQGLLFEEDITLLQGYSDNVQFDLDGDDAQWFVLTQNGNSVTISIGEAGLPATDQSHLLFSVVATQTGTQSGNAAIVISLAETSTSIFGFASSSHVGRIENGMLQLDPITLLDNYDGATFSTLGAYNNYFNINQNGDTITLELINQLPDEVLLVQPFIVFEIQASRGTASATTTVVLEIVRATDSAPTPVFSHAYYSGSYSAEQGLLFEEDITLLQGYSDNVQFDLDGDDAQWFVLTQNGNSVTISIGEAGLPATDQSHLLFSVVATQTGTLSGNAAIVISLAETSTSIFGFASSSHVGRIENGMLQLDPITLLDNYDGATFSTLGAYNNYFNINQNGDTITLELINQLPDEVLLVQPFIVFEIQASRGTASATTTVVLEIVRATDSAPTPVFSQAYYSGSYSAEQGLLFEEDITLLQGYSDNVQFDLDGDDAQWFVLTQNGNSVTISIGEAGLPATDQSHLLFSVVATQTGTQSGNAAIVISLAETSTSIFGFASSSHVGRIENGMLQLDPITLLDNYDGVTFSTLGAYNNYFNINQNGDTITVELINQLPDEVLLVQPFIVFEIQASGGTASATTTVVLEIVRATDSAPTPVFSQAYYSGSYSAEQGLLFEEDITLVQGFSEDVQFSLDGGDAQWFTLTQTDNSVSLAIGEAGIPETGGNSYVFSVVATRTGALTGRAAIIISLSGDSPATDVEFDSALYRGIFDGTLQHEPIAISGYDGTEVELFGEYQELFEAAATAGAVSVQVAGSPTFSSDVLYVGLEMRAGGARAALVIDINHSEQPVPPTVVFESSSYEVSIDAAQTGLVGRVLATASNGEPVVYSLAIDDAHLQERLSISSDGELQLFATADTGIYNFAVTATSATSQVSATATVRMTVEAVSACGQDDYAVPPLIVINRDEEANYSGLVVLDPIEFPGCRYEMTNRWPLNQNWLYVDDAGLHTTAIDREDESIAFMALSQVQVELVLVCDTDAPSATRSRRDARPNLGPYDYGNNEWVLTETIQNNPRRSLVNLVVNDINDNAPVFVEKENEPVAVGYPVADLLQVVTPRALINLKATDRDIGINAELVYWSSAPQLAVGPNTGAVYVRDNERSIAEGTVMTVHATDQAGDGLTGDIDIEIRLLDEQHIAVVTVRDAFEEEEAYILGNLTNAIGYEVKSLSSVVISDEYDTLQYNTNANTRWNRQAVESRGASLRLYVYGLFQRNPVDVGQLTNDINNNVIVSVAVADTVSLQDYLASLEICEVAAGRDIGLLVATIVLSVILFILIVLIGLWYILKWRKGRNYEEFSDRNSIASRIESSDGSVKAESTTRPRLNIEEIKRSERRLREMLDAPIEEDIAQPEIKPETKVEIPVSTAPIVIQSIDKLKDATDDSDEDEFGERKARTRKKSVVTFNENVEKIIHVEDNPEENDGDIEIFKL